MTLGVCERCSGIDRRSEGVVDVLGAMVERGERAAHARSRFRSAGDRQPDRPSSTIELHLLSASIAWHGVASAVAQSASARELEITVGCPVVRTARLMAQVACGFMPLIALSQLAPIHSNRNASAIQ